ncbi:hypothetical protein SUGI_0856620 [Cryptomeria japonica]|nr:hypothetical protein SUGI_0856620 [Cryptomeria japonica]
MQMKRMGDEADGREELGLARLFSALFVGRVWFRLRFVVCAGGGGDRLLYLLRHCCPCLVTTLAIGVGDLSIPYGSGALRLDGEVLWVFWRGALVLAWSLCRMWFLVSLWSSRGLYLALAVVVKSRALLVGFWCW